MLVRFLKTYSRRRWVYAIGETVSMSLFVLCVLALISGRHWPIGIGDLQFPFLASCIAVLSLIMFIVLVVMREQDTRV